jgi:hypothetical protein
MTVNVYMHFREHNIAFEEEYTNKYGVLKIRCETCSKIQQYWNFSVMQNIDYHI